MNYNLTELVYIIDMSGSMGSLVSDTIGGYNSMLQQQRQIGIDNPNMKANVTTVLFDDRYIVLHDREDIDNVKDITDKEYVPCGMTAMLDAIGKTIVSVGQKLAATPEEERPGLVSVTIITDGIENASKEYTWKAVHDMITEQKEKYSWIFSFIGADIDVEKTSYDLGIDSAFAKQYTKTGYGTATVYGSLAKGINDLRTTYTATCASIETCDASINAASIATSTLAAALDDIE